MDIALTSKQREDQNLSNGKKWNLSHGMDGNIGGLMNNGEIEIIEKDLKIRSSKIRFGKFKGLSLKGYNTREEEIKRIRKQIMRGEYHVGAIDLARKIVRDEVSRLLSSQ